MKFKIVKDGYIYGVGVGDCGVEITDEEYNAILDAIPEKPQATETTDYRLTTELVWESYEVSPAPEPPEEIDDSEALNILLGGTE